MAKVWRGTVLLLGVLLLGGDVQSLQSLRNAWRTLTAAAAAPLVVEEYDDPAEALVPLFPNCYMSVETGEELIARGRVSWKTEFLIFKFASMTEVLAGDAIKIIENHFKRMVAIAFPFGAVVWMDATCKIYVFFPSDERGSGTSNLKTFLQKYYDTHIPTPGLRVYAVCDHDAVTFWHRKDQFQVLGEKLKEAYRFISSVRAPRGEAGVPQIYRREVSEGVFIGISFEEFIGSEEGVVLEG